MFYYKKNGSKSKTKHKNKYIKLQMARQILPFDGMSQYQGLVILAVDSNLCFCGFKNWTEKRAKK